MVTLIDNLLNKITMYRLVLYHLLFLLAVALLVSWLGILPFSPLLLVISTVYLLAVCLIVNFIFYKTFNAPTNNESVYITALILALLISPPTTLSGFIFLTWAAVWAMASKYIFAIGKKHLFNPAAFAVALTALTIGQSASWWVSNITILPFVLIGGFLIIRKLRQSSIVLTVCGSAMLASALFSLWSGFSPASTLVHIITHSPLFFFATVMFTEPLTMPPTKKLQYVYAALVGIMFAPQIHVGSFYSTPEIALLVGNLFSYLVSPKIKQLLTFIDKTLIATDTYDFAFAAEHPFNFKPGQYMEWTLPHSHSDSRGNRRYFTIASSPAEPSIHLGVKFYPNSSSFKKSLADLKPGDVIGAAQLAGDFVLPKNLDQKIVCIAGGIGITPFRSMVNHALDQQEKRSITLFYAARTTLDFAYWELFEKARQQLGMQTVYVPSDIQSIPADWKGERGTITPEMIQLYVPDFTNALFYLSGPHGMVTAFQKTLHDMGIPKKHIKTDFFPGFV